LLARVGMTAAPHIARVDSSVLASSAASASSANGNEDDVLYVLMASDGLWDVATDEVCIDSIC